MGRKMTVPQRAWLTLLSDGKPRKGGQRAAYSCRRAGWTEFLYEELETGMLVEQRQVHSMNLTPMQRAQRFRLCDHEKITEAGRKALAD